MDELRQYLMSVIAAALICAIVQTFQQGAAKVFAQLVCGLFLAMTVIKPVTHFDLSEFCDPVFSAPADAQVSAEQGEKMSREALADIIKAETEAYILDKAIEMGSEISADVTVTNDDFPVPESAVIQGSLPAHTRNCLQEILCTQLGIAKENLTWIG